MTDLRSLYALVFLAGVGTLATEICASRLLAPYYGSSTIVWANIIGLTLASLSLGYWLGGRVADRDPSPMLLGRIVLAAAVLVALIPFVSGPILDVAASGLDEVSAGAVVGSFFATLLLFAPPIVLLGMVAPFAIRLALHDVASAGQVAGRLYALSTVGSLFGTFVPALIAIPLIGTQRTLLAAAALLAAASATVLGRRWLVATAAIAVLLVIPPGAVKAAEGETLFEVESPYQYVQVVEEDGVRRLYLNEGIAVHSVWREDTVLTGGVWDAFLAVPSLLERAEPRRVAILGNAGGTVARAFGEFWPKTVVDGVEIDPAVSEAGRRYFGMEDNDLLQVHDADARPFLRRTEKRFDLVYIDAYHQPYVPFYLATKEFFELVRGRLAPGGIVALNVATVPGDRRLEDGLAGTLATVFPVVRSWPALRFNHIVIGFAEDRPVETFDSPFELMELVELLERDLGPPVEPADEPWTDDLAPVEWVTDRMILSYAAEGGRLDEDQLPTAP